jgi:hypothetical protein
VLTIFPGDDQHRPHPGLDPVRVQRRASSTGVIMLAGQKAALGRVRAGLTVAVLVSDTTLTIEFGDGDVRVIRRTTTQPVRSIKGERAADSYPHFLGHLSHINSHARHLCTASPPRWPARRHQNRASRKRVQHTLEHPTPIITLNTYVGEWPDTDQETSTIMDAALGQVPRMCPSVARHG